MDLSVGSGLEFRTVINIMYTIAKVCQYRKTQYQMSQLVGNSMGCGVMQNPARDWEGLNGSHTCQNAD
jgi:hypothetical protein